MNQDGAQPVSGFKGFDSKLKIVHILLGESLSLMSEDLMELDREKEIRNIFNFFYPGKRKMKSRKSVKCAVYLNNVDILSKEYKRMKTLAFFLGIDYSFPIFVAPSSRPYEIACHENLFYRNKRVRSTDSKQ